MSFFLHWMRLALVCRESRRLGLSLTRRGVYADLLWLAPIWTSNAVTSGYNRYEKKSRVRSGVFGRVYLSMGEVGVEPAEEIESAIDRLPPEDYKRVVAWLREHEQARWDEQMDRDSSEGGLGWTSYSRKGDSAEWPPRT